MTGRNYVTVVTGFPRSGTSLMMQMLVAGGIAPHDPEHAIWPAFESRDPLVEGGHRLTKAIGLCVKHIEPLRFPLPKTVAYRFIAMRRNPREQARSHIKMLHRWSELATVGPRGVRMRALERSLRDDFRDMLRLLGRYPRAEVLVVRFEEILADPLCVAEQLGRFLGPINEGAAAGQVLQRPPQCLPYMLEERMVQP